MPQRSSLISKFCRPGRSPLNWEKSPTAASPDFPPPGELKFNGFPFRIRADGKTVAVGRGVSAEQVKLPLPANRARAVNLLHAVDWNLLAGWLPEKGRPVGFLDITYADGKCESIPVRNDVDCGNRTAPNNSCPNAALAITSAEGASPAGFYASSFALSGERPVAVAFRSAMPGKRHLDGRRGDAERPSHPFPGTTEPSIYDQGGGTVETASFRAEHHPRQSAGFLADQPAGRSCRQIRFCPFHLRRRIHF